MFYSVGDMRLKDKVVIIMGVVNGLGFEVFWIFV